MQQVPVLLGNSLKLKYSFFNNNPTLIIKGNSFIFDNYEPIGDTQ